MDAALPRMFRHEKRVLRMPPWLVQYAHEPDHPVDNMVGDEKLFCRSDATDRIDTAAHVCGRRKRGGADWEQQGKTQQDVGAHDLEG